MKSIYLLLMALLVSANIFSTSNNLKTTGDKTSVLTYNGITEDGLYKFTDAKNNEILFDEVSEDVEIDLSDEAYFDKKITVTWTEEKIELTDDEGEPTGETTLVRTITKVVV